MYLERVIEEDKKMVDSWKGDAEGMLVFTGLFSAVVATLLQMSLPNIQASTQAASAFYLARLYQQSNTQPNGSQPPIPSSLTDPIEPFVPPTSAVWVNGLWFSSLVIGLTCGLLATLLQQWARRYERVAYPRYTPHRRARVRAFYKHGVEKLHIPWTIEVLPVLLHISLFLFFAGLSVFLFTVHLTIFKVVTIWIGVCAVLYAVFTFMPIIRKDSPYSAPLSSSVSFCLTGIRHLFFRLLHRFPDIDASICMPLRNRDPRAVHLGDFFSHSMSKTAEKYAFELDPDIDHGSLLSMFQSLDEDKDFEKFFEGLPRLCDSDTGKSLKLQEGFILPNKKTLSSALIELMNRTLSSNLAPEHVQQRRLIICTKAIESTSLFGPWWILRRVLLGGWNRFLGCIEFGSFVQSWKEIAHPVAIFYRQCVAALTISIVREHDERWNQLVRGLLGVSKALLQEYTEKSDGCVRLANAIFIVRRTVQTYSGSLERHRSEIIGASSKTLETVCKLDIRCTLPELQHEFCGLWNQLVATAQSSPPPSPHHGFVATTTLKNIRKMYIALHKCSGTPPTAFYTTTDDRDAILDNPKSYPMCTTDSHLPFYPIPDLQFDEPAVDDGPPTPNMTYPPIRPSTFPTPFSPSTPCHTLSAPTHYGSHFVDTYSHLGAPPPNAAVSFPQPQFTPSHAPNVQPGVMVGSPPPLPPRMSTSGGHGQTSSSRAP
jgi:hypothetical protein